MRSPRAIELVPLGKLSGQQTKRTSKSSYENGSSPARKVSQSRNKSEKAHENREIRKSRNLTLSGSISLGEYRLIFSLRLRKSDCGMRIKFKIFEKLEIGLFISDFDVGIRDELLRNWVI